MSDATIDQQRPSSARVWNYILGGKDNFEVDRTLAAQILDRFPEIAVLAREQRRFLGRAIGHLVHEAGVRQFLDIGTGLPTADNTHEIAQRLAPESRIVYVDNDPLVLVHARALLTSTPEGATDYIDANVEDPGRILAEAARTLDFSRPIALTMLGILGNVADYDQAREILRHLLGALPSGSYLVLSDGTDTSSSARSGHQAARDRGHPYNARSVAQVEGYFEGLTLLAPGVVPIPQWRPGTGEVPQAMDGRCGVALKP
ncbi:SAM-dependent methyltransferase [Actinoplanes sp. NPDC051851]|uniref:SAM-dependent methyltransferase n=1 Tax=Actinoplanes sp. NPDC051851 TaxID=3154753 RepID=UPI003441ED5F